MFIFWIFHDDKLMKCTQPGQRGPIRSGCEQQIYCTSGKRAVNLLLAPMSNDRVFTGFPLKVGAEI